MISFVNLTTVGLFTINFYRILRNWVSILFNENVEYKRRWVTWEGWRMTAGRREVSMTASMGGGWPLGGEGWVWPPARVEYDRCSRRMGRLLHSSTNPYPLALINYFPAGIFSSHWHEERLIVSGWREKKTWLFQVVQMRPFSCPNIYKRHFWADSSNDKLVAD